MTSPKIEAVAVNGPLDSTVRETASLAGEWSLRLDPDDRGLAADWAVEPIDAELTAPVPGCLQSLDELAAEYPPTNDEMPNAYSGTAWLERTLEASAPAHSERCWLKFGGICPGAHVWLDGTYVGYHGHAPTAVKFDVTDVIDGGDHRLTVAVVDTDAGLATGFQCLKDDWSGLYRTVEFERTAPLHLEDTFLRPDLERDQLRITADVYNDGAAERSITPRCRVAAADSGEAFATATGEPVAVPAGAVRSIDLVVPMDGATYWTPEHPFLYAARLGLEDDGERVDEFVDRFGMRSFETTDGELRLNGEPFVARGAGQEFQSPTISPLVDRDLIRDRWSAFRDLGFNFHRHHTHAPTDEELQIADEEGVVLSSEGATLVSNFNDMQPYEDAKTVLEAHIHQTRNHPSLGVYCLGNEGSQVMVGSETERQHAIEGYDLIGEHAPDHVAMIAWGLQGELPELPNDVESPHLWGQHWQNPYGGLTHIPWRYLEPLSRSKPTIMHEYGKFSVWPDPAEEALYPEDGYSKPFGQTARRALEAVDLAAYEDRLIDASRQLAYRCNRAVIEEARRQPGCQGHVLWRSFRRNHRNSGVLDDLGQSADVDPALYRERCNAPVALLIDRTFDGRALGAGATAAVDAAVSNFGPGPIEGADLEWALHAAGDRLDSGTLSDVSVDHGANQGVGTILMDVPERSDAVGATLEVGLRTDGEELATSEWPFWIFPETTPSAAPPTVHDVETAAMADRLRGYDGQVVALDDANAMVTGVRSPQSDNVAEGSLEAPMQGGSSPETVGLALADVFPDDETILVADEWDATVESCLGRGTNVLLLDTGAFPDSWHPAPYPSAEHDVNRIFTPFRSGESDGTIVTLVHDHPVWDSFPHEGFADLQFFEPIQGARPVETDAVLEHIADRGGEIADATVALRPFPNISTDESLKHTGLVETDDWAYLLDVDVGTARVVVSTLDPFGGPAGRFLFEALRSSLGH